MDSVRKLRWYDREDLAPLVEANTRELQAMQDTVTALRQVPIPAQMPAMPHDCCSDWRCLCSCS